MKHWDEDKVKICPTCGQVRALTHEEANDLQYELLQRELHPEVEEEELGDETGG